MSDTEDPVVANRRSRLKLWIDTRCAGSQKQFIASTNDGEKQINQGELSGLLRSKSFGEKRARSLEKQAHMPAGFLDARSDASEKSALPATEPTPVYGPSWPFHKVSPERLMALRQHLGPQRFADAIDDMDELLESTLIKWERRAETDAVKSAAA